MDEDPAPAATKQGRKPFPLDRGGRGLAVLVFGGVCLS
jgi:hypothetical protein